MRDQLAKRLAHRAAKIAGDPLLTGEEDHWQSLSRFDQRVWAFVAAEAAEMTLGSVEVPGHDQVLVDKDGDRWEIMGRHGDSGMLMPLTRIVRDYGPITWRESE